MKRLVFVLAVLLAQPALATIALVQKTGKAQTSGTTLVITPGATITLGNDVILIITYDPSGGATLSSVKDSTNTAYTQSRHQTITGTTQVFDIWTMHGSPAATSVTATFAASQLAVRAALHEYSGVTALGTSNSIDQASTTSYSISISTQDANNWIVGGFYWRTAPTLAVTWSPGTFREECTTTVCDSTGTTTSLKLGSLDNTVASAGSVSIGATLNAASAGAAIAIELRSVITPVAPTPPATMGGGRPSLHHAGSKQ